MKSTEERYPTGKCVRCHEEKSRTAFPVGGRLARRRADVRPKRCVVCFTCLEAEAHEVDARITSKRSTWTVNGKKVRRCAECGEIRPLGARNFHVAVKAGALDENGHRVKATRFAYYCRPCHAIRSAKNHKKRAGRADYKAQRAASAKRWRERNPERARDAVRAHKRRVKEDPARWEEHLEKQRINYRLRLERAGVPLEKIKPKRNVRKPGRPEVSTVPSAPIVAFINTRIEQRKVVENFLGSKLTGKGVKASVLEDLDVEARTLYRWEHEQDRAAVATVERALMRAEVEWTDVYSHDDHPDLYAEGGVLEGMA